MPMAKRERERRKGKEEDIEREREKKKKTRKEKKQESLQTHFWSAWCFDKVDPPAVSRAETAAVRVHWVALNPNARLLGSIVLTRTPRQTLTLACFPPERELLTGSMSSSVVKWNSDPLT